MHRLTLSLTFMSEQTANDARALLEEIFAKQGYRDIAAEELHRLGVEAQRLCMSLTSTSSRRGLLPRESRSPAWMGQNRIEHPN